MKLAISLIPFFYFMFSHLFQQCNALKHYRFELREKNYTRLCNTKSILTVNGQFPGPTISVERGESFMVDVINRGCYNVTIHWHGAAMTRNPWNDGAAYITQCPIPAGGKFRQRIILGDEEEGTLWWHAHSNWTRATVHGAFLILPKPPASYPFPKPHAQHHIILGEWYKVDIQTLYYAFLRTGGDPKVSDAFLINGQPGDNYPCSKKDTFKLKVVHGKTYLLRIINAVMQNMMFFGVANHKLRVVGTDGSYTKAFSSEYITISPGQTIDVLLEANQRPNHYYMAARVYERTPGVRFDGTTTTAIIQYHGHYTHYTPPPLPNLPSTPDLNASLSFTNSLRSLASKDHPIDVPIKITTKLFYTLSMNTFPCEIGNTCQGPNNTRLSSSVNNISFITPEMDLLETYYYPHRMNGQYLTNLPDTPPLKFNYTASDLPLEFQMPKRGTWVKVLEYNATVELVFQGTSVVDGADHPMHLHGYNFYVVGSGLGNFDKDKDPLKYNLVDPPYQNTIAVPYKGWTAIRFRASNPGVWFVHCHLDRHSTWGMEMAFIVKNGKTTDSRILPPPPDMPPC